MSAVEGHPDGDQGRTGVPLLDGAEWVDPDEHGADCACCGCYLQRLAAARTEAAS